MTTRICTDCKHCVHVANMFQPDFFGCERPLGVTSSVTGKEFVLGHQCKAERAPQGFLSRLFGRVHCGPDAIYFETRRTPSPPMVRR